MATSHTRASPLEKCRNAKLKLLVIVHSIIKADLVLLRLPLTGDVVRVALTELDALVLDVLALCVTAHWRRRLHAIDARAGTGCHVEHHDG